MWPRGYFYLEHPRPIVHCSSGEAAKTMVRLDILVTRCTKASLTTWFPASSRSRSLPLVWRRALDDATASCQFSTGFQCCSASSLRSPPWSTRLYLTPGWRLLARHRPMPAPNTRTLLYWFNLNLSWFIWFIPWFICIRHKVVTSEALDNVCEQPEQSRTRQCSGWDWTRDLQSKVQRPNHYATQPHQRAPTSATEPSMQLESARHIVWNYLPTDLMGPKWSVNSARNSRTCLLCKTRSTKPFGLTEQQQSV